MKKMRGTRRILALWIAVVMLCTCMPLQLMAGSTGQNEDSIITDSAVQADEQVSEGDHLTGDSSAQGAPDDLVITEEQKEELVAAQADGESNDTGQSILLIEDALPWKSTANHTVLGQLTQFDTIKTTAIATTDLSQYAVIVFANDQSFSTYGNYSEIKNYVEDFVSDGGVLVFGACDAGWADGELVDELPGGVTKANEYEYHNYVADNTHPIVTGDYTDGLELTNENLYGKYCSHTYFDLASIPDGADVILVDEHDNPTLVEYPFGNGTVIASGLTWEHNYVTDNGYGHFAETSMDDLYTYALRISGAAPRDINNESVFSTNKEQKTVYVANRKTQKAIANATVTVDGQTVETNKSGIAVLEVEEGNYEVTVAADNYTKTKKQCHLKAGSKVPVYLYAAGESDTPYLSSFIGDTADKSYDLLQNRVYFKKDSEDELNMIASAEWEGHEVGKYILYQETTLIESTDGKFSLKPGQKFAAGKSIYLMLVSEDGTKSQPVKTGITINEKDTAFIGTDTTVKENMTIGNKTGFTIPADMPIIGGTKFEISLDSIPMAIYTEENKVRIVFGGTKVKSGDDAWKSFTDNLDKMCKTADRIDKCKELMSTWGAKTGSFSLGGSFSPAKLNVSGYAEGVWKDGAITKLTGRVLVGSGINYKYNHQFIVGPVPVYFEIGGGATLELDAQIRKVLMETGQIVVSLPLTFTPSFTIGGGAGINGAISAGASGTVSLPVTLDIPESHVLVKIKGSMSLKASLLFVFNAEKKIAEVDKVILDKYLDSKSLNAAISEDSVGEAFSFDYADESVYAVQNRAYLSSASMWNSGSIVYENNDESLSYSQILQEYVLPGSIPQMEEIDGQKIMIFQSDNGGEDDLSYTRLMYSVMQEDQTWQEPQILWDNGAADYYATLKKIDGQLYVVWQKEKAEKVTSTSLNEESTQASLNEENTVSAKAYVNEDSNSDELSKSNGSAVAITSNASADSQEAIAAAEENTDTAVEDAPVTDAVNMQNADAVEDSSIQASGNEETVSDIQTSDIAQKASELEIAYAKWDSTAQSFADFAYLTDNDYYDGTPTIAVNSGSPVVVWLSNEDNDVLGNQGSTTAINTSSYTNGKWSMPMTVELTTDYVSCLDAAYIDNAFTYVSIRDTDGDLTTSDDTEAYVKSQAVTSDSVADSSIKIIDNRIFWAKNGTLVEYTSGNVDDIIQNSDITVGTNYTLLPTEDNGGELLWLASDENGSSLKYSRLEDGSWTLPSTLSSCEGEVQFYSSMKNEDGSWDSILGVQSTSDDTNYYLEHQHTVPTSELQLVEATANDIDRIDGQQTCRVALRNNGTETIRQVTAVVTNAKGSVISEDVIDCTILPGETVYEDVTADIGQLSGISDYTIQVKSAETAANTDNNTATVTLGYNDVSVSVQKCYLDHKVALLATVTNNTDRATSAMLDIRADSQDGDIILTKRTPVMQAGEEYTYTFSVDKSYMDVEAGTDKIYYFCVSADDEQNTANNQDSIVIPTTTQELTGMQIEQGKDLTVNYDEYLEKSIQLNLITQPVSADAAITWSTSDAEIATVNETGNVTVHNSGNVSITASAEEGSIEQTIRIHVVDMQMDAPDKVKVSGTTYNTVSLSWNGVSGIQNYEVLRADSEAGDYVSLGRTSTTAYTDKTAELGKTYYYKVRSYMNSYGLLLYGNLSEAVDGSAQLDQVTNLNGSVNSYNSVYLTWTKVDGADGYNIYRATSKTGSYKKIATTSSKYYTDRNLTPKKTYYYKVRAYASSYNGKISSVISVKPTILAPGNVYVSNTDFNENYISYSSVSGASGYEIYRATSAKGKYSRIARLSNTSYYDRNLSFNKTYYYKVRSYVTVSGKTYYSSYSAYQNSKTALKAPRNLQSTVYSSKGLKITWDASNGASGYEVYRSTSYSSDYKKVKTVTGKSYTDKTCKTDTYYYYKVRAYRKVGSKKYYSDYSSYVSGKAYFASVQNVKMVSKTATSITISWSKMADASGCELWYSNSYSGTYKLLKKSSTLVSYTHKNLKLGDYYYYKIRTYKTVSGKKEYASDYIQYGAVKVPSVKSVKVSRVNDSSLKVSWSKVSNATEYSVYRAVANSTYYSYVGYTTTASYVDKDLVLGENYSYEIRVRRLYNGSNYYSDYSSPVSGKVLTKAPKPSISNRNKKKLKLTWKKAAGAKGYVIYRATSKNGTYKKIKTTTSTSYTDKSLKSGKTYYYKMQSYGSIYGRKVYSGYGSKVGKKVK